MSSFAKIWALKWLEGFIVSYFISRTSLDEVLGVKPREIGAIIGLKNTRPSTKHIEKNEGEKSQAFTRVH